MLAECELDSDLDPIAEHTQLLEFFLNFQLRWRPLHELIQGRYPIGIDADVTEAIPGGNAALPGNSGTAEIQGIALIVDDHLDYIGIIDLLLRADCFTQGGDAGVRVGGENICHLVDRLRRNQGFVGLHIDDDVLILEAQLRRDFLQAIGAGAMLGRRHADPGAEAFGHGLDALIVGGNIDCSGGTGLGLLERALDHGFAGDVQ